jgi:uncharacterized protein YqjF (DUF2071 family)
VKARLPDDLEVNTFDGSAWLSVVIFRLNVRPRWLPFLPGLSSLTEVNLRTYVRHADRPGITFLSVHADNRIAIRLARLLTPMPYHHARLRYQRPNEDFVFEGSSGAPSARRLAVRFRTIGESYEPRDGCLDAWLLERYRLFLEDRRDHLLEAEVTHPRWSVHGVELLDCHGSWDGDLARPPDLVHFAPGVRALFGSFRRRPCVPSGTRLGTV